MFTKLVKYFYQTLTEVRFATLFFATFVEMTRDGVDNK